MAKLTRALQKIFGLTADTSQFGQIGSDIIGSIVRTKDIATIQALSNYLDGLFSITDDANQPPAIEDINSLYFMITRQLSYLFQSGVPEWIATENYYSNKSVVLGSDGNLYKSLTGTDETPNINHDPVGDVTNWAIIWDKTNDGVGSGLIADQLDNYHYNELPNGFTNVKKYGAVGDGTTDDTSAIQSCISASNRIFFPDGNYKISDSLTFPGAAKVTGPGAISQTVNKPIFVCNAEANNEIEFSGITFVGTNLSEQTGINFAKPISSGNGPAGWKVMNCNFYNLGIGIKTGYSIAITSYAGSVISNCSFYDCAYGFVADVYGEYVTIIGNNFVRSSQWAIWTQAGNINIQANNLNENANGIKVKGATGTNDSHGTIMGNMINHITGTGISLDGMTVGSETIIGNKLYALGTSIAINIINCSGNTSTIIYNEIQGKITGSGNTMKVVKQNNFLEGGADELPGTNYSVWKLETPNGYHRIGEPGSTTALLGIGRTPVSYALEVAGIIACAPSGGTGGASTMAAFMATVDGYAVFGNAIDSDLVFWRNSVERMRINTSNHLLIGTQTQYDANAQVQLNGTYYANGSFWFERGNGLVSVTAGSPATVHGSIATDITTGSKWGVNRTPVTHTLEVGGAFAVYGKTGSTGRLYVAANGDETGPLILGVGYATVSDNVAFLYNQKNTDMLFLTGGTEKECFRINYANNYLLVGYTSSQGAYRLQVNGGLFANGALSITGRFYPTPNPTKQSYSLGAGGTQLLDRGMYLIYAVSATGSIKVQTSSDNGTTWYNAETYSSGSPIISDGVNVRLYASVSTTVDLYVF